MRPKRDAASTLPRAYVSGPTKSSVNRPRRASTSMPQQRSREIPASGAAATQQTQVPAARVGPTGRVYANDVQPQMLNMLSRRLSNSRIGNVTLIEGTLDDPKLPAASVDLVLMVDVYHECIDPEATLRGVRKALKPGGRLVLVEFRGEDPEDDLIHGRNGASAGTQNADGHVKVFQRPCRR